MPEPAATVSCAATCMQNNFSTIASPLLNGFSQRTLHGIGLWALPAGGRRHHLERPLDWELLLGLPGDRHLLLRLAFLGQILFGQAWNGEILLRRARYRENLLWLSRYGERLLRRLQNLRCRWR